MEKLGQLHAVGRDEGQPRWDLIVVDTPPSRSALDFLDAPSRLSSFLDGRLVRTLSAPARVGGRMHSKVLSAGLSVAGGALSKVLGPQLLTDLQMLVTALDTTFGGFRQRADHTYALLKAPGTAFVVVATPADDALREASYFVERLGTDDMPLAGVVINRAERSAVPRIASGAALRALEVPGTAGPSTVDLLRLQAEIAAVADRHAQLIAGFEQRQGEVPLVVVPAEEADVHDLHALRKIGQMLAPGH